MNSLRSSPSRAANEPALYASDGEEDKISVPAYPYGHADCP
jgi:hypothetical protein